MQTQMTNKFNTKIIVYNYIILGTAELCRNCSSFNTIDLLKDGFDSHRFSKRKWVLIHCWKSVNIRGIPKLTGKFLMLIGSP